MQPLRHFLLAFDHKIGELVQQDEFEDAMEAIATYEAAEREYDQTDRIEVVLIGSDSIETVRQTHGNDFAGTAALAHAIVEILKTTPLTTEALGP